MSLRSEPPSPRVWLLSAEIMSQLGGGFRQQRWCEHFLRRGIPVRIYCLQGAAGLSVVDCSSVEELQALRRKWTSSAPPRAGVRTSRFAAIARRIKHLFVLDLFMPNVAHLFWRLRRDAEARKHTIVFLCSSPPFSLGVAAALAKATLGGGIVLALDMRDLWSLHAAMGAPKFHKRVIEAWVMRRADVLTTVSKGLGDRFEQAFGRVATLCYNVATHVQRQDARNTPAIDWATYSPELHPSSLKLVYTGSMPEGYYDLDSFAKACSALARANPDLPQRLQFLFIGACAPLRELATARGLPAGLLCFASQKNHADTQRAQGAADGLVFLGFNSSDNQGQVSIKLFEYFRTGKPIFPTSIKPGSDVDMLLELYCGRSLHLISAAEMQDVLSSVITVGTSVLPAAVNPGADDQLLRAYDRVTEELVQTAGLP